MACRPRRLPAMPPTGLEGDRAILIHLLGYQDWSPSSPDSRSGTSSDHGSSGPRFVPFDWVRGLLDGQPGQGRCIQPGGCRPPASTLIPRNDGDDNGRGPRPLEYTGCGRSMERSPSRSGWERDILVHATEDWERCRSRSPPRRVAAFQDPLLEMAAAHEHHQEWEFDPMVLEAQQLMAPRCYHPMICYSPVVSGLPGSAPTRGQLPVESQVEEISDRVTKMDIDATPRHGLVMEKDHGAAGNAVAGDLVYGAVTEDAEGGCDAFCKGIFKEVAPPLLPRPATSPRQGGRGRKRVMVATRSSLRQAARPSPVPMSQRAQRKLMRELQFIDSPTGPPDAAVTEYIDRTGSTCQHRPLMRSRQRRGWGLWRWRFQEDHRQHDEQQRQLSLCLC